MPFFVSGRFSGAPTDLTDAAFEITTSCRIRRCFQSGRKEVEEEMQSGRSDSCGIQCIGGVLEDIGLIGM